MENEPSFRKGVDLIVSSLIPLEPKRHVFSILREIYVDIYEQFFRALTDVTLPERSSKLKLLRKQMNELHSWLAPPVPPLTQELALDLISKTDSPTIRSLILQQIGRRARRGQPVSEKRYRAILALDGKYAFPNESTLRGATNALCPCGLEQHTKQCQEQFRQQINRAVKLLKSFGYDFTWDRIGTEGWKEKIE